MAFHLAGKGGEQEAEFDVNRHVALGERERAGDAAALKMQGVAVPLTAQVKLLIEPCGEIIGGVARFFERHAVAARNMNVGHASSPCQIRVIDGGSNEPFNRAFQPAFNRFSRLRLERAPVLNRFGDVGDTDAATLSQIGNRARHFEDTMIRTR